MPPISVTTTPGVVTSSFPLSLVTASSVHWFRKGLRLHDNPALLAAVRGAHCVRCVYILDPWFAASSSVGINRWR